MNAFPGSPRLVKGALVGFDIFNPAASMVPFQYNPDSITRTLRPRSGGASSRSEPLKVSGPPQESLRFEIVLDATDGMERADPRVARAGVQPQLAALEMLLYPKSALVIANAALMAAGVIEVVPQELPLTLLIFGPGRVLPVRVSEMTITEEAHDARLNPIRAKVQLGIQVLSYQDFSITHPGYHIFLTHQIVKEALAVIGSVSGTQGLVSEPSRR
jgi:hypothetical protein